MSELLSNKPEIAPISDAQKSESIEPGWIEPKASAPFIDKISLTIVLPDDLRKAINGKLEAALKHTVLFQHARPNNQFLVSRMITLNSTADRVRLDCFPRPNTNADCRIEFNPNKVGFDGIQDLNLLLMEIFPDGWDYVVTHANVTRLDVTVDVANAFMEQFLFMPQQGTWNHHWRNTGRLETMYFGKAGSNQWKIYNKTAEQKKQGIILGADVVRLERTLRNTKLKLGMLASLPNPFQQVVFTELLPPPPLGEKPHNWLSFMDSVLVRGVTGALAILPEAKRTRYRKHLKAHPTPWWKPGLIWKEWPKCLQDLL